MSSATEQLREYEGQLAEVTTLLADSPTDESLLALQRDLLELIGIAKAEVQPTALTGNAFDEALRAAVGNSVDDKASSGGNNAMVAASSSVPLAATTTTKPTATKEPPKKKSSKVKAEFEVPKHLVIGDSDSTAERNRKRRAVKALKNKWKESVKEAQSDKKQKSWQSFQKKKKIKGTSMFQTGDNAVGVVSAAGRQLTEFEERKRHKHTI